MEHLRLRQLPLPIKAKYRSLVSLKGGRPLLFLSLMAAGLGKFTIPMALLGEMLGNMHTQIEDFADSRPNSMSAAVAVLAKSLPRAGEI